MLKFEVKRRYYSFKYCELVINLTVRWQRCKGIPEKYGGKNKFTKQDHKKVNRKNFHLILHFYYKINYFFSVNNFLLCQKQFFHFVKLKKYNPNFWYKTKEIFEVINKVNIFFVKQCFVFVLNCFFVRLKIIGTNNRDTLYLLRLRRNNRTFWLDCLTFLWL